MAPVLPVLFPRRQRPGGQ